MAGGRFHHYPRRVAERQSGQRLLRSGAARLARCRGIDFPQPPLDLLVAGAVWHQQGEGVAEMPTTLPASSVAHSGAARIARSPNQHNA
jgi:hypothetical protein